MALRYYGVPCIYVYGRGNGENHAWNMVKLGKYWYHYDPTWQDGNDKHSYLYTDYMPYFNVSEKIITLSHTIDKEAKKTYGFTLPSATKTDQEYYTKNKKTLGKDWQKKLASMVAKAKKSGKKAIGIRFSSKTYFNAAVKLLKNVNKRNGFWQTLNRKYNFSINLLNKKMLKQTSWFKDSLVIYFSWQ